MSKEHQPAPAAEEPTDESIAFDPVPLRGRRDGWTDERQRAFIAALARIGSVSTAAKHAGKTRRSAYKLRRRPGAESFAAAWDEAAQRGRINLHDHVIDRALNGATTPIFRQGRQTGTMFRYYDSLAHSVLSGRAVLRGGALEEAEERGGRKAFFSIEKKWLADFQELQDTKEALRHARDKIALLVRLGVITSSWLDDKQRADALLETAPPDIPPPAPAPVPEPRRPGIGISSL